MALLLLCCTSPGLSAVCRLGGVQEREGQPANSTAQHNRTAPFMHTLLFDPHVKYDSANTATASQVPKDVSAELECNAQQDLANCTQAFEWLSHVCHHISLLLLTSRMSYCCPVDTAASLSPAAN